MNIIPVIIPRCSLPVLSWEKEAHLIQAIERRCEIIGLPVEIAIENTSVANAKIYNRHIARSIQERIEYACQMEICNEKYHGERIAA